MAGVWTAAGLQGHDGASNSLSRSLSSLMAADENGHPSTVYLRSNMPPSLRYSVGSTLEREPAYPSETVLPLMRQSSAPTPKFEKLLTNSSSSVQYMGKKIIREYQSAFVLPDKQTVTVTRVEIFFPEQAKAEVTINLAVGSEREVPVSYMRGPPKVARRRIRDYLQHNSWASAMLASSESRDAELLGRMGSKYSDTICRRSRLERSESRKSRQEVVIAQQASSDEEDFDQGSMSEEDLKDKEVEYSTRVEGPTRPRSSVEYRVYREENSFNAYRTRQHSAVSEPEFSRAPVIAHAEPPGKRVIPMSDITSKQNFKELRRQWDERIAEEIRKSSDEWINYSSQRPTKIRDQRSPQSSVVTPAYPARYDRTEQNIQSFSPRTSHTLPPSLPASQFPEADPMRSGKTVIVERDDFGPSALSPTSVISEPSTERGEKETQFIYNQRLLRFNRGEVNRLDATRQDAEKGVEDKESEGRSFTTQMN
ncbi:unnamed protein product [Calicophoron daubneyi]|uniref:Uncharacterized protein n=1 Tax=Calicophoron daubneyi TaxID=300641 RepID=A0AAV2T0S8_CALDB